MTLLSAYEDLVVRTLAPLPGLLARLLYLGSLRTCSGEYSHWGMAKMFGDSNSSAALAQAHAEVCLEVQRTPICALFAETRNLAADSENWREQREQLTPPDVGGGSKRHFNSVLLALFLLSQAAKKPSPRAS